MNLKSKYNIGDSIKINGIPVKITSIIVNATEDKILIRYSVNDRNKIRIINEEKI